MGIKYSYNSYASSSFVYSADLVPVYSFGENEAYKQVVFEEGSWGRWVQRKFQKYIGFAPCVFHGCGFFSAESWGLVPYSNPITTVGKLMEISRHVLKWELLK